MYKLLLIIPFIVAPFLGKQKAAQKDLAASVIIHIKSSHKDREGIVRWEYATCSGTYISANSILTAAHCFEGIGNKIWVRDPYNLVGYPVHLVYWDKKADLALLDAPFGHSYVKIGSIPATGDRVLNIGNPYDFEFVESEGRIGPTSVHAHGFTSEYLITTAMANPGSSGGGAFNDRGELIGVNTMILGIFGWNGLTLTVNTDSITLFLGQALRIYHHHGG